MSQTINNLNIKIKGLRSRNDIPFVFFIEGNSIVCMVDEEQLGQIATKIPGTQLNDKSEQLPEIKWIAPDEYIKTLTEIPANFVFLVPTEIFSYFVRGRDLNYIITIENHDIRAIMIEYNKELIKKDEEEKEKQQKKEAYCSGCALGALNRKYALQMLPYYPDWKGRISAIQDLQNAFTLDVGMTTDNIKNPAIKSIADAYLKDITTARQSPGCTSCKINGIKAKYIDIVKKLAASPEIDKLFNYGE